MHNTVNTAAGSRRSILRPEKSYDDFSTPASYSKRPHSDSRPRVRFVFGSNASMASLSSDDGTTAYSSSSLSARDSSSPEPMTRARSALAKNWVDAMANDLEEGDIEEDVPNEVMNRPTHEIELEAVSSRPVGLARSGASELRYQKTMPHIPAGPPLDPRALRRQGAQRDVLRPDPSLQHRFPAPAQQRNHAPPDEDLLAILGVRDVCSILLAFLCKNWATLVVVYVLSFIYYHASGNSFLPEGLRP